MLFPWIAALSALAAAAYALLALQLIRGLRRLRARGGDDTGAAPFITVLIAARNEERNLPRVLNALLEQDYPRDRFQVVVVDDRSTDKTAEVLRRYAQQNPGWLEGVSVESAPTGISPKKRALMKGLESARGEWIAVTDADCRMGPRWLSSLSREFGADTGMVLGLTAYEEPPEGPSPGFGTKALEFVSYGIVSAALVGLEFPVIANANNLAYRRRAFEEAGGFRGHGNVVSGDDDFVLQEIHATGRWAVHFCAAPEALMRTAPPDSWGHFWEQRKRWASKCGFYRPRQTALLGAIFAFYAAIPVALLAGIRDGRWAALGLAAFGVKALAELAVMRRGLKDFGLGPLLRFFPVTELLHIPLILAAVLAGSLGGFTWKGQRLSGKMPAA